MRFRSQRLHIWLLSLVSGNIYHRKPESNRVKLPVSPAGSTIRTHLENGAFSLEADGSWSTAQFFEKSSVGIPTPTRREPAYRSS